jgi:hypothetical protein
MVNEPARDPHGAWPEQGGIWPRLVNRRQTMFDSQSGKLRRSSTAAQAALARIEPSRGTIATAARDENRIGDIERHRYQSCFEFLVRVDGRSGD